MKIPRLVTPAQYEEYQSLKTRYERDLLFESINSVSLEFDIDEPIKTCVMAFALLDCMPIWSCCGFDYDGQPLHKHHQYGRCYFTLGNADRSLWVARSMIQGNMPYYQQWGFYLRGAGVDLHFDFKNVIQQWDDADCIHYSEQASIYIASLERLLLSLSEYFKDSTELVDTNSIYKQQAHCWQYPPKEPWLITKSALLARVSP